jgi:hypothetical protein
MPQTSALMIDTPVDTAVLQDNETGELCAFKLSTQPLLQLAEDQDVELLDCPKFQDDLHNNNWHYRCAGNISLERAEVRVQSQQLPTR